MIPIAIRRPGFRLLGFLCLWVSLLGAGYDRWEFNGNLNSAVDGGPLYAVPLPPLMEPSVRFAREPLPGGEAGVMEFGRGTAFWVWNRSSSDPGSPPLNEYTLILDLKPLDQPLVTLSLLQTDFGNLDDAEWSIRSDGTLGIPGNSGGTIVPGAWVRLALVADSRAGTLTSYLDGERVAQSAGLVPNGRWALGPFFLLLADNDGELGKGRINSFQLRSWAMSADDIKQLGPVTASGIPEPEPPTLTVVEPVPGTLVNAGEKLRVVWTFRSPQGGVRVELTPENGVPLSLGDAPMGAGTLEGWVPPWQPDGPYTVTVRSLEFPGTVAGIQGPVTIRGSRPLNPRFGQPLETNGGFEQDLARWRILEGAPQVLPTGTTKGKPHGGEKFLHGGINQPGDGIVRQELDLGELGFTEPELSDAVVRAEAWVRNQQSAGVFDDQVYARVAYLGADGAELGSVRCLVAGDRTWQSRVFGGRLPPGTRRLGLEVVGRHRRDADNDSMADDLTVRLDPLWPPVRVSPSITKLPMLQDVRRDAMRLLWETDSNLAAHSVEWGRRDTGERTFRQVETIQIDDTHFVHRATLEGLEAETEYTYRVRSGDSVTPAYSFRTAPRPGTPFVAAWWGDNHQGTDVLRTHVENLLKHSPDLICVAGDMVNFGNSLEEWHEYWFQPLEHLNAAQTVPVIFARGNHDGEHALSYAYSTLPGNESWFAFDYGDARMIFLDSEAPGSMAPEQREWLRQELLRPETQRAAFRIVCFHKPPWSQFWNGGGHTQEEFVLREWIPLFRLNGVDLVISGHEHAYHRGARDGVTYVVTGGGGGFLDTERVANWRHVQVEYTRYHFDIMTVNGPRLSWETYDTDHELLDEFTIVSRVPSVGISETGGKVELRIEGRPGLRYQIEAGTDLGAWAPEGDVAIPADGSAVTWRVEPADGRRFLRLVALP